MRATLVVGACVVGFAGSALAGPVCIDFRSGYIGNAPGVVGQSEDNINYLAGSPSAPIPMNAATFLAAQTGPAAKVIQPIVWTPTLPADALARWINPSLLGANVPYGTPMSALYAVDLGPLSNFNSATSATLTIHWLADDTLGDPSAFNGVFLNSPANSLGIGGGGFITQSSALNVNVPVPMLQASNTLYLYQRDIGAAISGIIFSGQLCVVPTPGAAAALGLGSVLAIRRRRRTFRPC